jgi:hypothetical protein
MPRAPVTQERMVRSFESLVGSPMTDVLQTKIGAIVVSALCGPAAVACLPCHTGDATSAGSE